MIAAVLDTNVIASGFVRAASTPGEILLAWRANRYLLVTSEHILSEVERTLASPYFQERLGPDLIAADMLLLRTFGKVVSLSVHVHGVATHPEDDLVLATAVSGHADILVTGDRQLLKLGTFEGVDVLNPRAFLALLQGDPS